MDILLWMLFGSIVGWVASMLMEAGGNNGLAINIAVGAVGAVVGGWVMSLAGEQGVNGITLYSFAVAVIGACIFIAAVRMVRRSSR